jgi:hypothetical protein
VMAVALSMTNESGSRGLSLLVRKGIEIEDFAIARKAVVNRQAAEQLANGMAT